MVNQKRNQNEIKLASIQTKFDGYRGTKVITELHIFANRQNYGISLISISFLCVRCNFTLEIA